MEDQTGMQPAAPQAAPAVPVVKQVKELLSQDKIKEKFGEVLGQKAPQFMASITNTVSGSAQLKKCPANSIIGAAFVAATYDLPIDSNLGFAAIVPYNESVWNPRKKDWEKVPKAQFQMMYKGFIQLAIRSGYYERMNYAVVYKDELESYNPITGEIKFVEDFSNCKQRDAGDEANVAGYYAWFRLKTGYSQELYMSKKAVDNHARKYSQAYRYDLNNGGAVGAGSSIIPEDSIQLAQVPEKSDNTVWSIMGQAVSNESSKDASEGDGTTFTVNNAQQNDGGGKVEVNVNMNPVIKIEGSNMDEEKIFQVLQNRIREMADDLGDEIAERMGKIFNNMPAVQEA